MLKATIVRSARLFLMQEDVLLGGQAVLEGVMMRLPRSMAVAVRRPDGGISVLKEKIVSLGDRHAVLRLPVVRGAAVMIQALILGFRSLTFSANEAFPEESGKKGAGKTETGPAGAAVPAEVETEAETKIATSVDTGSTMAMAASLLMALGLGFGLFFLLPLGLTHLLRAQMPALENSILFNLVDGAFRIVIFLAYIFGISLMRDIRRVFEYHGAEHKTVYAHEDGLPLTVDNVRTRSRLHPRCGTSFLLFVMVVSILVFSFLPGDQPFYLMILPRLALIPLIAGLSYEAIRFSARRMANPLCRSLIRPGLWLQRITTREPSDDQLAVAIRALEEALAGERAGDRAEVVPA